MMVFGSTTMVGVHDGCNVMCNFAFQLIHSRIHSFKDLYSASSRKLLRGAPDSSTVKKNSA